MFLLTLVLVSSRRDTQSVQDQPIRGDGAPPATSTVGTASSTKLTGSTTMTTDQEDNSNPAVSRLQQPQHLQQLNEQHQLQQSLSHLQQPPHSQQHQWGAGLLQQPHLPQLPNQHFSHGPFLTAMGAPGILGPTPVWPGSALVWGPRLLGGYHNSAVQGNNRYRGGQRGGSFNGM